MCRIIEILIGSHYYCVMFYYKFGCQVCSFKSKDISVFKKILQVRRNTGCLKRLPTKNFSFFSNGRSEKNEIVICRSLTPVLPFKGAGSRNRKQTCYLHDLYCCPHVAIVLRSDFDGWGEPTIKLLLKIHQYICNPTTYECLVYFSRKFKSPSSNNTYILRKVVENLCDKDNQKS